MRPSGREADEIRSVRFTPDFTRHAEGSVLAEFGDTRVLCTASVEDRVPVWMRGKGSGWVTGEYGMLPRSTHTRIGARSGARQTERQDPGDRAIDRPFPSGDYRSRGAGRAHGDARLRCAPGRWWHAHGVDQRRLRRARARDAAHAQFASIKKKSAARPGRSRVGRRLRRRRGPRPRLCRRLGSRDRHEHRHERSGPVHRSAGHGGRPRVQRRDELEQDARAREDRRRHDLAAQNEALELRDN